MDHGGRTYDRRGSGVFTQQARCQSLFSCQSKSSAPTWDYLEPADFRSTHDTPIHCLLLTYSPVVDSSFSSPSVRPSVYLSVCLCLSVRIKRLSALCKMAGKT